MISREYSQTSRIKRERIVHAELCTEISDRIRPGDMCGQSRLGPALCIAHVFRESLVQLLNTIGEGRIRGHLGQSQIRNLGQQQTWILLALLPQVRIEVAE